MIRRRCRGFSRPCASAASTMASITPSPRCGSSSPSRTRSGSHASASTVPSRRTTAGAVTTGRQNSASSPADGAVPAALPSLPRGPAGQRPAPPPSPPESPSLRAPQGELRHWRKEGKIARGTPRVRRGLDTQRLPGVPSHTPKPAQNTRSQRQPNRQLLKSVVLAAGPASAPRSALSGPPGARRAAAGGLARSVGPTRADRMRPPGRSHRRHCPVRWRSAALCKSVVTRSAPRRRSGIADLAAAY